MGDAEFDQDIKLKSEGAAEFLRNLADSIENDEKVALEGEDWKVYQPYQEIVPFRIVKDETGLEIDLKLLNPEDQS